MKCRLTQLCSLLFVLFIIGGCSTLSDIVPQLPKADNYSLPVGQDIAQANALLAAGKKREAASAYFSASGNYRPPERERLILQAAELAAIIKDTDLTQKYLAPITFSALNPENQARYRFTQAQLALNDDNYRETLRILPQRVNDLPHELGEKILNARMSAAKSSGDKLALVQELVLQEPNLKEDYQISLNHDRIWNHAKQIPAFQLNDAKNRINHPVLKNWLDLAQLARISKNGSAVQRESLRGDLANWLQRNPNHPGNAKAVSLLNAAPDTVVTPYVSDAKPAKTSTTNGKKQIAVLLPLTGNLSGIGKALLDGIQEAHRQNPNNNELKIYNTLNSSVSDVYQEAVSNGTSFVIGPFNKSNISRLSTTTMTIPTLGLNYVDGIQNPSGNLYQFGLSPDDEAIQVAQYATNQNQKRIAILSPDSAWGRRLQEAMRKAVIERLGKVILMESYRDNAISYAKPAESIAARADEIDAIMIAASPTQARRLYPDLRQQVKSLPIYATSHVFNGLTDRDRDAVLEGLIFTETPWVLELQQSQTTPNTNFPRLHAMGMDAYKLSSSIDSLKSYGNSIDGKTGTIRLSNDGSLHRTSSWARFSKGLAIPHGG